MKTFLIIMLLLLVGMITLLYWPATIKQPEFVAVRDFEVTKTGEYTAEARATAVFYNPNSVKATLLNTEIKIFSQDVRIGSLSQTKISEIPPLSQFEVPLVFNINGLELAYNQGLSGLVATALDKNREIPIEIDGYCRIKAIKEVYTVPVKYKDKLSFR